MENQALTQCSFNNIRLEWNESFDHTRKGLAKKFCWKFLQSRQIGILASDRPMNFRHLCQEFKPALPRPRLSSISRRSGYGISPLFQRDIASTRRAYQPRWA